MTHGRHRACTILSAFLGTFLILAIIIAYSQYLTLKKTLIAKISEKATALIGQKVEVGDISLSTAAGITIRNIIIRNPEGFIQGDLLRIDKVHLGMRYGELFKGRFSFRDIEVYSPELALITGKNGKLNVSDAFIARLSKKGTTAYQVDELKIRNARFSFNADPLFDIRDAGLTANGISSASGAKTTVKFSMAYLGGNRLAADGWVFPNDRTKQFNIDVSSEMADLSLLAQRFLHNVPDMKKSRLSMTLHAEGDTDKGVKMNTGLAVRSAGISFFRKEVNDISFNAEAFLAPNAEEFVITRAVLRAGESSSVQMKGALHSLLRSPSYEAEVRIDRLDLSTINIMKGLKAEGMVNSGPIRISGNFSGSLPEAAGAVSISNGSVKMEKAWITAINGQLALSSGKEMSVRAAASSELQKAGDISFRQPAAVHISLEGRGKLENILLSSQVEISGVDASVNGKLLAFRKAGISFRGNVRLPDVSGDVTVSAADVKLDDHGLKDLLLRFGLSHGNGKSTIKGLAAESEIVKARADTIVVAMPGPRGTYRIDVENISASYPAQKAELSGLDCAVTVLTGGKAVAGDITFSLKRASFHDATGSAISGKGSFDGNAFTVDIPAARVLGGTMNLSAKGTMQNGPFPVHMDISAEHLDLAQASAVLESFGAMPYRATGELGHLSFRGTAASAENITGTASLKTGNLAVTRADSKNIIKGAAVSSEMTFRGKDMDIRANAAMGSLSPALSGTINRFGGSDRSLHLNIALPETNLNDIRTAFWDMFPDALLYAGLGGSIDVQLATSYDSRAMTVEGAVVLRDITIEGENNEYAAGPVSGTLPVHYDSSARQERPAALPSVERADFEEMKSRLAGQVRPGGSEIAIGSIRYGFRLLQDVSLRLEQKGRALNISSFSAKMFGGRLSGAASMDLSPELTYQAGLVVDGISLTQLCEDIAPIKGYISGKVNGIAAIRGSGPDLAKIIGKADFWTYSDRAETTRISREFLEKIGGPQVRAYLGERRFNKGIMNVYIQNGFLIFRDLEISNRNLLGMTDLSVKVAPLNNRIAIDHLMWTITEAAQRAKK